MEEPCFFELSKDLKTHCCNTRDLSILLGIKYGLNESELNQLYIASEYHDIGKIKIPNEILNKPTKLSEEEFEMIKQHTKFGYEITLNLFTEEISKAIYYHHENENGSGYYHLSSSEIPIYSKIIHIADVYDALKVKRCYKSEWAEKAILDYFEENNGVLFDKDLTELFFEILKEKRTI